MVLNQRLGVCEVTSTSGIDVMTSVNFLALLIVKKFLHWARPCFLVATRQDSFRLRTGYERRGWAVLCPLYFSLCYDFLDYWQSAYTKEEYPGTKPSSAPFFKRLPHMSRSEHTLGVFSCSGSFLRLPMHAEHETVAPRSGPNRSPSIKVINPSNPLQSIIF